MSPARRSRNEITLETGEKILIEPARSTRRLLTFPDGGTC
jgi:hypothetical protein